MDHVGNLHQVSFTAVAFVAFAINHTETIESGVNKSRCR